MGQSIDLEHTTKNNVAFIMKLALSSLVYTADYIVNSRWKLESRENIKTTLSVSFCMFTISKINGGGTNQNYLQWM